MLARRVLLLAERAAMAAAAAAVTVSRSVLRAQAAPAATKQYGSRQAIRQPQDLAVAAAAGVALKVQVPDKAA